MELIDLIKRYSPPVPWEEGDNIPWNEPGFSSRMLKEHLSQEHDAASRRFQVIDQQVEWIHTSLLSSQPMRILDLGCGPGLYSERLARLGHTIYGIDFSPASIEYATATAKRDQLPCTFLCQDIRQAQFPSLVSFVMLIYGEFNVFRPTHARLILEKIWAALDPGGILLLETHPYQVVRRAGEGSSSWYSSSGGLFSPQPHVVLKENFWDENSHASTIRYFVMDASTGLVTQYAQSLQAYQNEEYASMLSTCGFGEINFLPGLLGENSSADFLAIIASKPTSF